MAKEPTPQPLPPGIQLETLKAYAKRLLEAVQAAEARALARVAPYFDEPGALSLQRAQLVVAREHGFRSWRRLKEFVELRGQLDELAPDHLKGDQPRCAFCAKAMHEVAKLIRGGGTAICNECVELCVDILKDADAWPNPAERQ